MIVTRMTHTHTCMHACISQATYEHALAKAEAAKTAFNRLNDELKEVCATM
jgi:hypothetical protein